MKKKWMCALLALAMLVSLLPTMVLNASAASTLTASEDCVALIESFEGFSANAYWDNTQWSIGYGTASSQGATITQADAEAALRSTLETIDGKINEFTAENNLTLTQNQHDALASLCYNCGTGWLSGTGRLKNAILEGKTGNDFLFAISLWANISSVPNAKLIQRRLCEANLYINGVYSKTVPSNWSYVIFDANGGTPGNSGEDKMQGFCTDSAVSILVENPTRAGYTFAGWYTSASSGENVEALTAAVAGKTLYAQWMDADGNIVHDEVIATGTVRCSTSVNIRAGAGTSYAIAGYAYNGDAVKIYEKATVNDQTWGRIDGGWICLDYVALDSSASATTTTTTNLWGDTVTTTTATQTGTVTGSNVNVRSGAGTGYTIVTQLNQGASVTVYETTNVGSTSWGRIGTNQWICMNYVQLSTDSSTSSTTTDSSASTDTSAASGQTGKVSSTTNLRVRSGAGTSYTATGYLTPGSSVTIYETTTVSGVQWGRIGTNQWVCMTYITPDSDTTSSDTTSSDSQTGTVTTALNVRSGAGTQYTKTGTLRAGDTVTVYETKIVGSAKWGRIGTNRWVCLSYVNLGGSTSSDTASSDTTNTTQTGKVSSTTNLRIRSGAGTSCTATGYLTPGSSVTIYETATVSGVQWGRIGTDQWVCLSYVTLDSGSGTTTTTQTGTVTTQSTALYVRSGAGTGYSIVGTVAKGTTVTIYETKTVGSVQWGRIGTNRWVSMSYITLSSSSSSLWN